MLDFATDNFYISRTQPTTVDYRTVPLSCNDYLMLRSLNGIIHAGTSTGNCVCFMYLGTYIKSEHLLKVRENKSILAMSLPQVAFSCNKH